MWKSLKPHLFLFSANLIYGANYTVAKEVMPAYIKPFGFIVIRVSVAVVLFGLFHQLFIHEKVKTRDIPRLIACGFFGVALNQLMFFKGLSLTTPINASLMMLTTPVLVLLMSSFFIGERLTWLKGSGILLGAAGAMLVITSGHVTDGISQASIGDIFVFINACSYAAYLIMVKPLLKTYHPVTVVKWAFFAGWFMVLPVGYSQFLDIEWQSFTPYVWFCVGFVVIGTTFFAYLFNILALNLVNPSIVGIYIYSQPVLATLVALSFGKDSITLLKIIAAVMIFTGVYLVSRTPEKQPLYGTGD